MNRLSKISFIFLILYVPTILSGNHSAIRMNAMQITFPIPSKEDLERGYVEAIGNLEGLQAFIQSQNNENNHWRLFMLTEQPYFIPIQMNKPHYDLLWKLHQDSESKYQPVRLHRTEIISGISTTQIQIDFRLKVSWRDEPAQYILEVLFELENL
jgi:hypothetical protein